MKFGGIIQLNKTSVYILCGILLFYIFYATSNRKYLNHHRIKGPPIINLNKLLYVAIKAAENGGTEVVQVKDNLIIQKKGLTKEGLIDSVTTADFLSHCSMIKTLKHFYSSLEIVSEEAKTVCDENQNIDFTLPTLIGESVPDDPVLEQDITVWIDPLDATYEYTEKLYKYVTVMVCVAVKGKPVIGVIHKPFNKTTSWAWVNRSKSKDLEKQVYKKEDILKVIISRSHRGEIEEVLHRNFDKNIQLVIAAGAGYKALEVAKGYVDAYLHITAIKKWDICAGNAIINSLGGKMTTKFNEEIDYSRNTDVKNENGLIATVHNHNLFLGKL